MYKGLWVIVPPELMETYSPFVLKNSRFENSDFLHGSGTATLIGHVESKDRSNI